MVLTGQCLQAFIARKVQAGNSSTRRVVHLAESGMLSFTPVNVEPSSCHSGVCRIHRHRSHMIKGSDVFKVLDQRAILVWWYFILVPGSHIKLTRSNGASEV